MKVDYTMMEETSPKRSLSEISHLFLSSVRDKSANGNPRPQRIPPGQARPMPTPQISTGGESIDLTLEQIAKVFGQSGANPAPEILGSAPTEAKVEQPAPSAAHDPLLPARRTPPVSLILGAHLNGSQLDRARQYARHLTNEYDRVGFIEIDGAEVRLSSYENGGSVQGLELDQVEPTECTSATEILQGLMEMNWDVDRWLVLAPNPRTAEARELLRAIDHWVLLSTCDHDGIVSSYRLLKGLADSHRPRLSLALLDSTDPADAERVYRKLASVCQQFLNWDLQQEPAVEKGVSAVEHVAMIWRATRGKTEAPAASQWGAVSQFIQTIKPAAPSSAAPETQTNIEEQKPMDMQNSQPFDGDAADFNEPIAPVSRPSAPRAWSAPAPATPTYPTAASNRDSAIEVIDLPAGANGADAIIAAILGQTRGEMIEIPVRAPMCAGVRIAITRDRKMVVMAVAREGLAELRSIGQAYRWVCENRSLIGMAIPQFTVDAAQQPQLRLLVDHADVTADVLHPIMHSDHVVVQAYRKLRWGGKTGLFLEAA